jgi:uncharacterized protein (TIGR04255 family)
VPLRQLVDFRKDFGEKAPITEALVDVRVDASPELSLEALRRFNETLPSYSVMRTQTEWAGQIRYRPDNDSPTVTSRHGVRGYVCHDEIQKRVVQVRRDGFTFSQLAPYSTWKSLRDNARAAWERYVEVARPSSATRVALRYINHLRLPPGGLVLEDWFRLHPTTPDQLGSITDALLRVAFRHPDNQDIAALVTLGTAPSRNPPDSEFLFDIDSWVARTFDIDDSIWATLEDLHEYKNDVFFGSLTDSTFERIQQ